LSLHLFEHVYGESRDRGQAMVNLRERYRAAGLDIASNELPDYLPLLLEFLAQCPDTEARQLLGEAAHVLRVLQERLASRGSIYAPVFAALEELGQREPEAKQLAEMRNAEVDDPSDLAALDRVWQETEVQFGPGGFGETACAARPAARAG
jgi:nitrate reductase delta subunit